MLCLKCDRGSTCYNIIEVFRHIKVSSRATTKIQIAQKSHFLMLESISRTFRLEGGILLTITIARMGMDL